MNRVDCLIVSTGRAGSTAIYKYLSEACGLNLPANKEPHYWCDIKQYGGRYELLERIHISDKGDYSRLYAGSRMVVDASCGYFFCLNEVINNLQLAGEKPKVVFMYREPLSRAASIFNEWKRKKLTSSEDVFRDVALAEAKDAGLWWESYYDNVLYMSNYKLMESYFDDLLLINYAAFARNPKAVFLEIAEFIGIPIDNVIEYVPHNSSAEAKLQLPYRWVSRVIQYLPRKVSRSFRDLWNDWSRRADGRSRVGLIGHLPDSTAEYNKLRNYIGAEDVFPGKRKGRLHPRVCD